MPSALVILVRSAGAICVHNRRNPPSIASNECANYFRSSG
jgi:hypothetical protein